MLILNSGELFPIVRKLSDPSDSATYYVRAVVRNSISGATINTVNLTNDGLGIQRFVGTLTVPTDASGLGLYIDIVTKVYSNSGYTTQDTIYSDEVETYLVGERWNRNLQNQMGAVGPSGPDINYKKIQKMVDDAVATIKFPEIKETDYARLERRIDNIAMLVKDLQFPVTDLEPVLSEIRLVKKDVSARPMFEKTDLTPLMTKLEDMCTDMDEMHSEKMDNDDNGMKDMSKLVEDTKKTILDAVVGIEDKLAKVNFIIPVESNIKKVFKEEQPVKDNISRVKSLMG